jgi:hypothetical protein
MQVQLAAAAASNASGRLTRLSFCCVPQGPTLQAATQARAVPPSLPHLQSTGCHDRLAGSLQVQEVSALATLPAANCVIGNRPSASRQGTFVQSTGTAKVWVLNEENHVQVHLTFCFTPSPAQLKLQGVLTSQVRVPDEAGRDACKCQ